MSAVANRADAMRRLKGLIKKETLQILRDPSSISIAFVLPAILLLLFGYGVSLDAKHVPVAVVVENPTRETASFTASLSNSDYFAPRLLPDRQAANEAVIAGEAKAIIVLRSDFARRLFSSTGAAIQVIVNGTDANTAGSSPAT